MNLVRLSEKNKAAQFSDDERELAEFFKAVSHPARVSILRALAKKGECVCGEIVEGLPLAQSTVSQHLKQLKEIGLIRGEVEGAKSCYCIDSKRVREFFALFDKFETKLKKDLEKFNACC